MLRAIDAAKKRILLSSYIFNHDRAGEQFIKALISAKKRGVEIKVIIDGIGVKYSHPPVDKALDAAEIDTVRFLPTWKMKSLFFINLRTHRKLLLVDAEIGFLGGMNISVGNLLKLSPRRPVEDLHFQVQGPVLDQLEEIFIEDWAFAAGERLQPLKWIYLLKMAMKRLAKMNNSTTFSAALLKNSPGLRYKSTTFKAHFIPNSRKANATKSILLLLLLL